MRTIVIGDLHGDWRGLLAILRETGAIDADERRLPDTRVIQLGDLIHGGRPRHAPREGVDDGKALAKGLEMCDTILIGNHELPVVWPDAGFPTWHGQSPLTEHRRGTLLVAYQRGQLAPATSVGDWLLTHAGAVNDYINGCRDAADAAEHIRVFFSRRLVNAGPANLFDAVGRRRGGRHPEGGIFWCDWRELVSVTSDRPLLPQIVGHTPQGDTPSERDNLWCVDVGAALSGRVAALITDDDGDHWEPIVVNSEEDR